MIRWHILTGEYPPRPGGVSDYTQILARKLAEAGDEVHVWTGLCAAPAPAPAADGVTVHRLPGQFGPMSLRKMNRYLRAEKEPFRLLIQYVPQMFGFKGMNIFLARWIGRARGFSPWVMFHEVAFCHTPGQPKRHDLLASVQELMVRWIARGMTRCFVSVPQWGERIRQLAPSGAVPEWLPTGSNVSDATNPSLVVELRRRFASKAGARVVAFFGTFGDVIMAMVLPALKHLLQKNDNWSVLLVGRGSDAYAEKVLAANPGLKNRLHFTGALEPEEVAAHLAAAHVLYQPYPDGVSSRRSSVMAGLALGLPIVTNFGVATETVWKDDELVVFADAANPEAVAQELCRCSEDSIERNALMLRARRGYEKNFAWTCTIEKLRR
ncbi:MAG: glycosyltransferase [Pedosphaera sp.]|nr:glycosyltransferase [Pedosphaera sp.]